MNANISAGAPGRLTLTRRGRVVLSLLAALLFGIVALIGPGLVSSATADAPVAPVVVEVYSISAGESLWQVAAGITAPGADVRDTIATIVDLNELGSVDVRAGQQLLLPTA